MLVVVKAPARVVMGVTRFVAGEHGDLVPAVPEDVLKASPSRWVVRAGQVTMGSGVGLGHERVHGGVN